MCAWADDSESGKTLEGGIQHHLCDHYTRSAYMHAGSFCSFSLEILSLLMKKTANKEKVRNRAIIIKITPIRCKFFFWDLETQKSCVDEM